jgi:flagellar biosynthesis protein FliP
MWRAATKVYFTLKRLYVRKHVRNRRYHYCLHIYVRGNKSTILATCTQHSPARKSVLLWSNRKKFSGSQEMMVVDVLHSLPRSWIFSMCRIVISLYVLRRIVLKSYRPSTILVGLNLKQYTWAYGDINKITYKIAVHTLLVLKLSRMSWKNKWRMQSRLYMSRQVHVSESQCDICQKHWSRCSCITSTQTSRRAHIRKFVVPPSITNQVSLVSTMKSKNKEPSPVMFEEDSDWIGLDTFSAWLIINDFYPKSQRCNHRVLGVSNVPTNILWAGSVHYYRWQR